MPIFTYGSLLDGETMLVSDKAAPARISASEMEQIRRARGRLPDRVRERLQKAGEAEVAHEPKHTRKLSPRKGPPGKR